MEFPDDPHTLEMCSEKFSDNSLAPDETKMKIYARVSEKCKVVAQVPRFAWSFPMTPTH